jgi:ABC-2 type transport system permease protein
MNLLRDIRLLFLRKLREALRQPVWIVVGFSTPLIYLALFAPLLKPLAGGPGFSGGNVLDTFVPGILVLMAFGAGMGAGWTVIWELDSGVLERLRVTPASRLALLLGTVLRDVVLFVGPAILVIAVAGWFGFQPRWPGTALLLVLLGLVTAVCSATSSALGMILRQIGSLAAVVTGFQLPLTLMSGVLLPLSLGPAWLRALAHLNPLYYAVEASRVLATSASQSWLVGADAPIVDQAFILMLGLTALVIWWAMRVYRKAVG